MYEVLEEWVPVAEFENNYPDLKSAYFLKINQLIVIYRVVRIDDINKNLPSKSKDVYFSLEDALSAIRDE